MCFSDFQIFFYLQYNTVEKLYTGVSRLFVVVPTVENYTDVSRLFIVIPTVENYTGVSRLLIVLTSVL